MPDEPSLRLRVLTADHQFLRENVEIRFHHMVLTDERVVHADASREIIVTGLRGAPQGLYRIEIIRKNNDITSQFVNIRASGVTDLEIILPGSEELVLRLPGDGEPDRANIQPGDSLDVEIRGLRPCRPYQVTVLGNDGNPLFTSTILSNREGFIENTALWPQIGLEDLTGQTRFPVQEALDRLRGRRITITLTENAGD